jgi:sulfide dehydrogenase [flavocytochrome c] flavoprotein subunit
MRFLNRREALVLSSALLSTGLLAKPALAQGRSKVVVVGGGFGGVAAARTLKEIAPAIEVALVTNAGSFTTCPFSNLVIAGQKPLSEITFSYDGLSAAGVDVMIGQVAEVDAEGKAVVLEDGSRVAFDRAILSPGIDLKFDGIPGYSETAAERMPHAWKAGAQTALLRDQLAAMPDGGVFVMSVPNNPYRCPPGPYERASLAAYYLSRHKPGSKIVIIDGKDTFSKEALFKEGWNKLYPGMITHIPFAENGGILEVVPDDMEVRTAFETFKGDVVNVIPPQTAGGVLLKSGLAGDGEWCPIDQATFESPLMPGVHVLGDSAIVGDMPKSGFSAAVQGSVCAYVVAALLRDEEPAQGVLLNTCYSFVSPDYGISVAGEYRVNGDGRLVSVEGTGGTSPKMASDDFRQREAEYAFGWYANLTSRLFG